MSGRRAHAVLRAPDGGRAPSAQRVGQVMTGLARLERTPRARIALMQTALAAMIARLPQDEGDAAVAATVRTLGEAVAAWRAWLAGTIPGRDGGRE